MCNAKLQGMHNIGLIHTLTQHWADPETIYHWIQPHVMMGGQGVWCGCDVEPETIYN